MGLIENLPKFWKKSNHTFESSENGIWCHFLLLSALFKTPWQKKFYYQWQNTFQKNIVSSINKDKINGEIISEIIYSLFEGQADMHCEI